MVRVVCLGRIIYRQLRLWAVEHFIVVANDIPLNRRSVSYSVAFIVAEVVVLHRECEVLGAYLSIAIGA